MGRGEIHEKQISFSNSNGNGILVWNYGCNSAIVYQGQELNRKRYSVACYKKNDFYTITVVAIKSNSPLDEYNIQVRTFINSTTKDRKRLLKQFGATQYHSVKTKKELDDYVNLQFEEFDNKTNLMNETLNNDVGTVLRAKKDPNLPINIKNGAKKLETIHDSFMRQMEYVSFEELKANGVSISFINFKRISIFMNELPEGIEIIFSRDPAFLEDKVNTGNRTFFLKEEFQKLLLSENRIDLYNELFFRLMIKLRLDDSKYRPLKCIDEIPIGSFKYNYNGEDYTMEFSTYPYSKVNIWGYQKFMIRLKKNEKVCKELHGFLTTNREKIGICDRNIRYNGEQDPQIELDYDFLYDFPKSFEDFKTVMYDIFKYLVTNNSIRIDKTVNVTGNKNQCKLRVLKPNGEPLSIESDPDELPF